MKTAELTGAALDWAVAKCEGYFNDEASYKGSYVTGSHFLSMWKAEGHGVHWTHSSTDWSEGGPIIEREKISLLSVGLVNWAAKADYGDSQAVTKYGDTPLIAAMRCYVASKLGGEVEVPEELM